MLDGAGERDRTLFRLMLNTGIRLSTALALDVQDLDLQGGVIAIWMKGDRRERMAIEPTVAAELGAFIGKRQLGPVFCARGGTRLGARQAQRRFRELAAEAGIGAGASPHALRHTYATRLYATSKDILVVKLALRHRSIESTVIYVG
ncbi:MAG: tyrosine-type recombinase/integrase [Planctomycetes bacterium]|nr:tyrosine-type recombinase/integrase [Planctomycetota bacterium]